MAGWSTPQVKRYLAELRWVCPPQSRRLRYHERNGQCQRDSHSNARFRTREPCYAKYEHTCSCEAQRNLTSTAMAHHQSCQSLGFALGEEDFVALTQTQPESRAQNVKSMTGGMPSHLQTMRGPSWPPWCPSCCEKCLSLQPAANSRIKIGSRNLTNGRKRNRGGLASRIIL